MSSQGCEILPVTNEFELLRFRCKKGVGVIYTGRRGISVSSEMVYEAYDCFINVKKWNGKGKPGKRVTGSKIKRQLIDRDGMYCFYCGEEFEAPKLTKEHVLSIVQGGPDRIENLVLACSPCNKEADHLPVIDKVKLRDKKRQKKE